jgi:hypothetical protein
MKKNTSSNWEKRHRLFEIYSKNLNAIKRHPNIHIDPDENDIFVCPLCFRYFRKDETFENPEDVFITIEHVPPKALGGKKVTLTCIECNNWSGYNLDSHLLHNFDVIDFIEGIPGSEVDTKIIINDDISLTGTASFTAEGKIEILYDPKRSSPNEVYRAQQPENLTPSSINIKFSGKQGRVSKQRRPECSLLRTAYLLAFMEFGYGFLINSGLSLIRGQLKNPTEEVLPAWGISRVGFPDESLGINIIKEPSDLQSFLVIFDVLTRLRSIRYGVMLPGPTFPGINIYKTLSDFSINQNNLEIKFSHIPHDDIFIRDPNYSFISHEFWKHWRFST